MSWPLAANWLTVAGLFLVTFGTGAQAWANLAEYASLRRTISEAALAAIAEAAGQEIIDLAARAAPVLFGPLLPLPLAAGAALFRISSPPRKRLRWLGLIPRVIWAAVIAIPAKMALIPSSSFPIAEIAMPRYVEARAFQY